MKINNLVLIFLLFGVSAFAQKNGSTSYWSEHKSETSSRMTMDIPTKESKLYDLDYAALAHKLTQARSSTTTLEVPMANNSFETFQLKPSVVMSPKLAAKYPNIKTYEAVNADGSISGRFDITPKGFHGMLFTTEGTVYIDPINLNNRNVYQCYYKKDYLPYAKSGTENDQLMSIDNKVDPMTAGKKSIKLRSSGTELRTYRLAITTTGEYTAYHGGTVPDALAAIVTTMNRVNGIYEREVSIRMVLIDNTDDLIYTDAATDPYTNNSASSYIDEVQANIDAIIGNANYDIGHGFSTGAGGLAGPGPCMTGRKATGVTGTSNPIGDPYDVDYVAHEIGHQFGANHTFNGSSGSCSGGNRNASTAYEPGSGTTILAYAGICSPQNIQNNSDPYFHTASYDEILAYSVDGAGNGCASITSTGNNPPVVDAGEGGFTIPINTPFKLTGSGSDPDGHDLTFSWEQFDLGPAGDPNSPTGNAPLFRSFAPKTDSSRYFPDLNDIVNNTQTMGELLPSYARSMTFRLTARDNQNGGGGVDYDQLSFDVTDQAGPFLVSSFNTDTTLYAQTNVDISWDVANTDQSPVNCQFVNILLSEDGGFTYPHIIKSNTPNDGFETILLPNVVSTSARIMIKAADNVFFDINNANINIETPAVPDFSIAAADEFLQVCAPNQGTTEVTIGSILGFSNDVTLEVEGLLDGLSATFSVNPVTPGNSSTLQINDTNLGANGTYQLTIKATENGNSKSVSLRLDVYDEAVETIELLSPSNGQVDVSLYPVLSWTGLVGSNQYDIDLATDVTFSTIIQSQSNSTLNEFSPSRLIAGTEYFWRVRATNICAVTDYSIGSFTTATPQIYASTDVPINISSSGSATFTSLLDITETGLITDLNVINLNGTHSYISDLTVSLTSPMGTKVTLFDQICGSQNDFDLNFDQQSPNSTIPCPPTDNGFYQPSGNLSDFNGEEINGTWTLSITDNFNQDGGQLLGWSLEVVLLRENNPPDAPTDLSAILLNNQHIQLKWKDNSSNEREFIVERSKGNNTTFQEITSIPLNNVNFEDGTLTELDTYFYRVKASNMAGNSSYSNEISISNIPPSPETPTDLTAVLLINGHIELKWKDNANNETGYIVERSKADNANFQEVSSLPSNSVSFEDSTLTELDTYFYRVKAVNAGGYSDLSNEISISNIPPPPVAPTDLSAVLLSNQHIELKWKDNANNETGYIVERSKADNANFQEVSSLPSNSVSFEDSTLTELDTYFYRVKAVNVGGDSDFSNEISISNIPPPPAAPTNLSLRIISIEQINLEWMDNSDNETGFVIERSKGGNSNYLELDTTASNTFTFQDSTLGAPDAYFYRVKAINAGGDSEYSNEESESSLVLGFDDLKDNTFMIYPNPGIGLFSVKFNHTINSSTISINVYDMVGNQITVAPIIDSDNQTLHIDIRQKSNGIYYILLNVDGKSMTSKLIKH
ncbi:MAG TPA: M12 family metallo-peptidase [Fulvivirga sp.]|nr:M12 family metallo-peptidase [Fulvivirga sp.]